MLSRMAIATGTEMRTGADAMKMEDRSNEAKHELGKTYARRDEQLM
jgi:hypothetical protein